IPVRYAFFGLVGAVGVMAQLVLVGCFLYNLPFVTAQAAAGLVVMVMNYFLNNRLTFRASRLRGWAWGAGLFSFLIACSIGLFCNVKVAENLHQLGLPWAISSGVGIFAGSIWNYG